MATVNFYLKEPKAEKETPINLFFAYGGKKPLKYPTKDKILPSNWNEKRQRIRTINSIPDYEERNAYLSKIESSVNSIYATLLLEGVEINESVLKDRLDAALMRVVKPKLTKLLAYSAWLAEEKKAMDSKDRYLIRQAADNIAEYCSKNKLILDFADMNLSFKERFVYFLNQKGYKQNTVSNILGALRRILEQAQVDGYNTYSQWRSRQFSAPTEKVKKIGLTPEEIEALLNIDLSDKHPRYNDVRDLFLIGFTTTMRVSDFRKLKEENIQDGKVIRKTQKTGKHVAIPMHRVLRVIMERRGGKMPRPYTREVINKVIKDVAEWAEIDSPVVLSYTKGGKRVDQVVKKFEAITTHTARRSSVRQMRRAGIDKDKAKLLSGHSSDSAFDIYDEIDTEETAAELANHPYFQ